MYEKETFTIIFLMTILFAICTVVSFTGVFGGDLLKACISATVFSAVAMLGLGFIKSEEIFG